MSVRYVRRSRTPVAEVIVPRAEVIVPREPACRQAGVISRQQLLAAGLTSQMIATRLERGRWQQLHWGVYAVFTGPPPRAAWLWAAVLRVGPGGVLKLATELDGKLAHPDQERWRDHHRDNQAGAHGIGDHSLRLARRLRSPL